MFKESLLCKLKCLLYCVISHHFNELYLMLWFLTENKIIEFHQVLTSSSAAFHMFISSCYYVSKNVLIDNNSRCLQVPES